MGRSFDALLLGLEGPEPPSVATGPLEKGETMLRQKFRHGFVPPIVALVLGFGIGAGVALRLGAPANHTKPALREPVFYQPEKPYVPKDDSSTVEERYLTLLKRYLCRFEFGSAVRSVGGDWPETGETMIGMARMDNLHECIRDVIQHKVPGDFIECGAWRGGATIFMRAALEAYRESSRVVWVADSFQGLPKPDPQQYPADTGDTLWTRAELSVPVGQVRGELRAVRFA